MEENQTNQNLNQQSVQPQQPVQSQPEQVQQSVQNQQVQQQPVQWQQQPAGQPSVSMQIQQLLVQQQQYQQQYNQLVEYVKNTPNLPIEQVNQIKQQLDQLNALFVEWKQKLQALWYNQVQVNKPTEVKSWSKSNFSFKKLAIWCGIVVLLILIGFFVTLISLRSNPDALLWIWIEAWTAKMLLQLFWWLLLWSVIILMLWVVISNIYRLITVKNQSKFGYVWWLIWWLVWVWIMWVAMWWIFSLIWDIQVETVQKTIYPVQPYLVSNVENYWKDEFNFPYDDEWISWKKYPLIAPAEFAFSVRWSQILNYQASKLWIETTLQSIKLICGNEQNQVLELSGDVSQIQNGSMVAFKWACLYWKKWKYDYALEIGYRKEITKENLTQVVPVKSLVFDSELEISLTTTSSSSSNSKVSRLYPTNWEFILWKAPAKISIDTTQVFHDFWLSNYNVIRDLDGDKQTDRENQVAFDYVYKIPQVYHPSVKFTDLWDFVYTFPVRVEQSDRPVCSINVERFPWTTKYQISTEFIDPADASKISSYNYTIKNKSTNKNHEILKDESQEFNYTFPEKWNYIVILDYVTIDGKQWRCDSEDIQLKKETFDVQYILLQKDIDSDKYSEVCTSQSIDGCKDIMTETVPQSFQLQIKSISPFSNTTKKIVYLDDATLLNENDVYSFTIESEWAHSLKMVISDQSRWMDEEEIEMKIVAKRPDIVWKMTISSSDTRLPISEWFEPLTVILDASKTEINIPWDEIVYFTWDFGDGEIKKNQQNGVVAHTYNFDYKKETWIFEPKVTITTLKWRTQVISWPILNVKKWLINIDISSTSHPTRQAQEGRDVTFQAEFDWLPEKMIRDFGDGSAVYTCQWRNCTEVVHVFKEAGLYSIKLTLEFDAIQSVDSTIDFKVY